MISIKITKRHNALVDDDYEYLQAFTWSVIRPGGKVFYAIRKIPHEFTYWNMSWDVVGKPEKGFVVDHINGEGLDNRRINLRVITQRQNCQNRHGVRSSYYPGVSFNGRKWIASISLNGVITNLGSFDSELDASNAYKVTNTIYGLPEVIMPFTEEPPDDPSVMSQSEYLRILQLMKQDGLSDREIEENLKGVRIQE
jgi:hypothetical protein